MKRRDLLTSLAAAAATAPSWANKPARPAPATEAAAAAPSAVAPRALNIGFALGAGSARGFAHIGVLKSLDQAGIKAACVAGTSVGALAGVFYAGGYTPWQLQELALRVRDVDVVDIGSSGSGRGMLAGAALQQMVSGALRNSDIERFPIPFGAVCTALRNGEVRLLRNGNAGLAVRASCSIPGVFMPTQINNEELVDGGLVSPLPVREARQMGADFVIAVDVGAKPQHDVQAGLYGVVMQSFEIMGRALTTAQAAQADFVIRPDTARFSSTNFSVREAIIQAGYEATEAALPALKAAIAKGRRRAA